MACQGDTISSNCWIVVRLLFSTGKAACLGGTMGEAGRRVKAQERGRSPLISLG